MTRSVSDENLSHTTWERKFHVVFIPKYRRKVLFGKLREHLGPVFRKLAEQKERRVEQGHVMPDHVHMMPSIPPKLSVSHGLVERAEDMPQRTTSACCNATVGHDEDVHPRSCIACGKAAA